LVTHTGAWFRYSDLQFGQGREKVRDFLRENPKLVEELREKIMDAGAEVAAIAVEAEAEGEAAE
jgi:recombination protein RecA